MNKRKMGLVIFFMVLMSVSHILLPSLDKYDWGPFYRWTLFSGMDDNEYIDIRLIFRGQEFYLTDHFPLREYEDNENKVRLWNFSQKISDYLNKPERLQDVVINIKKILGQDIQIVQFCRIKPLLPKYLILSSEKKKESCDPISF